MERRIKQAKVFQGSITPPASLKTLTRVAALALRASGETAVSRPPQGRGAEALARFLEGNFQNLTLDGGLWRLRGFGGDGAAFPATLNVGASAELLETLCPLFFDRGLIIEGLRTAITPRLRRILKILSAVGFSYDLHEDGEGFRLTLLQSAPGVVTCTLDNGDEGVKTACLSALAFAAASQSRLVEPVPVPGEAEGLFEKLGRRLSVADSGQDETETGEGEISELEKRIRKLQQKRREPGAPEARVLTMDGGNLLTGTAIDLYADPLSSAAVMTAAALHSRGRLRVGGFPSEGTPAFSTHLNRSGVKIEWERSKTGAACTVEGSKLTAREIRGRQAAALGELLPFVFVAGAYAEGETIVRDAEFLREGPVDLIDLSIKNLRAMGAKVGELPDGLIVEGAKELDGAEFNTGGSPAIALAFSAAALRNRGESVIQGAEAVDTIWPDFFFQLEALTKEEGS